MSKLCLRDARGASAAEIVVLVALIALGAMGAWHALGDNVTTKVACAAAAVAGADRGCATAAARVEALSSPAEPEGASRAGAQTQALSADADPTTDEDAIAAAQASNAAPPRAEGSDPAHQRSPIDEGLDFVGGVIAGVAEGVGGLVGGIVDIGGRAVDNAALIVTHPAETFQVLSSHAIGAIRATWDAVTNPGAAVAAIWDAATHLDRAAGAVSAALAAIVQGALDFFDTLLHAPWSEKGRALGRVGLDVALVALPLAKISQAARIGRAMGGVRAVELLGAYETRSVATLEEAVTALGSRPAGIRLTVKRAPAGPLEVSSAGESADVVMTGGTFMATSELPSSSLAMVDLTSIMPHQWLKQIRNAEKAFTALRPGGVIRIGVPPGDGTLQPFIIRNGLERIGFRDVVIERVQDRVRAGYYQEWVLTAVKPQSLIKR